MASKLKVACAGAGYFAAFHCEAWSRMDDVELAAICDPDPDRARDMASRFGIAQVFTDAADMLDTVRPGLFDIAAPPAAHSALVEVGAGLRVPMICQKPFCGSFDEARRAVELCEGADVLLVVHENFRFQPWYRRIRALLDAGALGTLRQASFRLRPGDGQGPDAYLDRQPYFQKMERFLVHETAIHLIDVFRYLFGDVTSVYAELARLNPAIAGEDAGIILFRFASGVRGLFDGNRLLDHEADNRRLTMGELLIEGDRGAISLDGDGRIRQRAHGANAWHEIACDWQDRGFGGDCVFALQRHVADHLAGTGELENRGRDYLSNLAVEDAIYRSNDEACPIALK